jgi:hypothetical protein
MCWYISMIVTTISYGTFVLTVIGGMSATLDQIKTCDKWGGRIRRKCFHLNDLHQKIFFQDFP